MRPANQVNRINVATSMSMDSANSQPGGLNGSRTIIIIGEVSGNKDINVAILPCGSEPKMEKLLAKLMIKGMVTGSMNCCVSDSLSTADPMAANMELYNK